MSSYKVYEVYKINVELQPVGWPGYAWGGLCEVWWEVDNTRGTRGASPNNN
jgi:hypothetical protein